MPEVEVQTRRRTRSYTDVPEPLAQFFAELGYRISWQREWEIPMLYSEGIESVNVEQLSDELRDEMARIGLKFNADGHLARGSVILCRQTFEDYEAAKAEYDAIAAAHQQRTDLDEVDEELRRNLGLGLFHPPGHAHKPADFVKRNPPPKE